MDAKRAREHGFTIGIIDGAINQLRAYMKDGNDYHISVTLSALTTAKDMILTENITWDYVKKEHSEGLKAWKEQE